MIFRAILVLLFSFCLAGAELLGEIELGKDEIKKMEVLSENGRKTLTFRWTLYKDRGLVMHLKYDNLPHQSILYKESLNAFKIPLSKNFGVRNPHITIYFVDFDDKNKRAKFRYYLFRENANIEVSG